MTLYVRPKAAQLTRDTEFFGNMDPYVKAKIGQKVQRSETHNQGGKHPSWKNQLVFREFNRKGKLAIDLFDENVVSDTRIGGGWIDLEKVLANPNVVCKERLSIYYDGKMVGVVDFELEFREASIENQPDELSKAVKEATSAKGKKAAPVAGSKNIGLSIEEAKEETTRNPPMTPGTMQRNSAQQILSSGNPNYQQNIFQQPPPQMAYSPAQYPQPVQAYMNPYPPQPMYARQPVYPQQMYGQPMMPMQMYAQPARQPAQIINPLQKGEQGRLFSMVGGMMMGQNGKFVVPNPQQSSDRKQQKGDGWGWQF